MRIRDWHAGVVVALLVTVLTGEWLTILALPLSELSLLPLVLLPLAALAVTSTWSAGRSRSSVPPSPSFRLLLRNAIIVVGGGALVASAAAVFEYMLADSGHESAFVLLVLSAAQIGGAISGLVFCVALLATAIRLLILGARPPEHPSGTSAGTHAV